MSLHEAHIKQCTRAGIKCWRGATWPGSQQKEQQRVDLWPASLWTHPQDVSLCPHVSPSSDSVTCSAWWYLQTRALCTPMKGARVNIWTCSVPIVSFQYKNRIKLSLQKNTDVLAFRGIMLSWRRREIVFTEILLFSFFLFGFCFLRQGLNM